MDQDYSPDKLGSGRQRRGIMTPVKGDDVVLCQCPNCKTFFDPRTEGQFLPEDDSAA